MLTKYERDAEEREREYHQMIEDNMARVNGEWMRKMEMERKRRDEMRNQKIKKLEEGEEAILLT